jgi:hypothetical protein
MMYADKGLVRMPQVAYETLWDTTQFDKMWPADGSNPFFLSYNDNKGYGTHADYLFGWKDDSLQKAMDNNCMFQACENGKPLKSQSVAAMNKCAIKSAINENLDGCKLPVELPHSGSLLMLSLGLDHLPGMAM